MATVLSQALPLQRSYWVPLTAAVVLKPDLGSVFAHALKSGAGAVIGASAGALILASRPPGLLLASSGSPVRASRATEFGNKESKSPSLTVRGDSPRTPVSVRKGQVISGKLPGTAL